MKDIFEDIESVDEDIVFGLENIYTQKKLDLDFYKREIDISFNNLINKIYNLIFQEIQGKLKKAEIIKDVNLINKYTQDKNILWQNPKK